MKEERQMMKKIACGFGRVVITLFLCGKASAYCHANAFGGSTAHTYGHTYHSNAYGGSTSHAYGEGTSHTNTYGGSTSHSYYGGTSHTNAYGGTTTGAYGAGAVHTGAYGTTAAYGGYDHYYGASAAAYHPPVTVNHYSTGCYNCGGWAAAAGMAAGAAVGVAAGAAAASSQSAAASN